MSENLDALEGLVSNLIDLHGKLMARVEALELQNEGPPTLIQAVDNITATLIALDKARDEKITSALDTLSGVSEGLGIAVVEMRNL
jgi:hypothetical protein